jgi:hypothetical protein
MDHENESSSDDDEVPKNNSKRKAKGRTKVKQEQTSGKNKQRKFDDTSKAELADVEASACLDHVEDEEESDDDYGNVPLNLSNTAESPQFFD